jgi:hypothetical protein
MDSVTVTSGATAGAAFLLSVSGAPMNGGLSRPRPPKSQCCLNRHSRDLRRAVAHQRSGSAHRPRLWSGYGSAAFPRDAQSFCLTLPLHISGSHGIHQVSGNTNCASALTIRAEGERLSLSLSLSSLFPSSIPSGPAVRHFTHRAWDGAEGDGLLLQAETGSTQTFTVGGSLEIEAGLLGAPKA